MFRCHHYGPIGSSSGQVPDIFEFYCYKLFELTRSSHHCPKHIDREQDKHVSICAYNFVCALHDFRYIATKWNENFEPIESVLEENSLCVDIVIQLVMLRVLLFISDLHEQNCGLFQSLKKVYN